MTRGSIFTVVGALLVVAFIAALIVLRRGKSDDEAAAQTATVTLAPVRLQTIQDITSLYGTVQLDPTASRTVAAPRSLVVSRMLVRPGETVAAGQPLVEVASAPGAELAFRQTENAVGFAESELARVQRLYDDRLAASDQLEAAKRSLKDAQAGLNAQQQQGARRNVQNITAPRAAIVTAVLASPGQHLAQDAPMLSLGSRGALVAKLAVQPGAMKIAAGQAVSISPTLGGPVVRARLSMVAQATDQATRTLDAIAPLADAKLPVGAAIQGDVVTGSHQGLIVPRASVVFDDTGPHLFTISGGKAHRVFVRVGADHADFIEVAGPVAGGAAVAVEGAYELQDEMAVRVRGE